MTTEIEKLKEIYLANDVDDEDYQENLEKINEWETTLRTSEDFLSWQQSDVTKGIMKQAKESYRDLAMQLMTNRNLTETERASIYAKQDACLWIIALVAKDAKALIKQIETEIKKALQP